MNARELRQLRAELGLSVKELADALGAELRTVFSWEAGQTFPTKRDSQKLERLKAGTEPTPPHAPTTPAVPDAAPDRALDPVSPTVPGIQGDDQDQATASLMSRLATPATWLVLRKLLAHPEFFRKVEKLAEDYPDSVTADNHGGAKG